MNLNSLLHHRSSGRARCSRKNFGFTLIELLVVISIIALLLSILMPSLGRAKRMAKNVVCLTNLKQWGLIWSMYTNDHNDRFPEGWVGDVEESTFWPEALRPYYDKQKDIGLCPEIRGFQYEGEGSGRSGTANNPWAAWGVFEHTMPSDVAPYVYEGDYGSYGVNQFVENHPTSKEHWGTTHIRYANNVPLFVECYWPFSRAHHNDTPPAYDGAVGTNGMVDGSWGNIKRFFMNRHMGKVTGLFVDGSARNIGLRELYVLKWSRNYDTAGPFTNAGGATRQTWELSDAHWLLEYKAY